MTNIPRNLRNNLISYANYVANNTPGKKSAYNEGLIKYLQRNGAASYNKQTIQDINNINSQLAIAIKKSRYDDLFDDFVKSGYINPEDLTGEDNLRESLKKSIEKNPNLKPYKERTPRKYNGLIRQFIQGMIGSEQGQKVIRQGRKAVLISEDTIGEYRNKVKEKQRKKFEKLVRQNKAVAIINKQTKKEQIIYSDKKAYRDLNTGRFARKPKQLQLR